MQFPSSTSDHTPWRWLALAGLLIVTASATVRLGVLGLLVGGLLVASWVRLPPEYPFTLGQFAILMAFADPSTLGSPVDVGQPLFLASELGVLAVLVTPHQDVGRPPRPRIIAVIAVLTALAGLGGWWSVHWLDSIPLALAAASGVAVLLALGSREYEYWVLETRYDNE